MNIKAFVVLLISLFSSFVGVALVTPFLPLYATDMGASGVWLGLIFSSFTITRAVVMPFIGPLSDRKGRKLFLCIGLGGYTVLSFFYVLATTPYYLVIIRAVQGATAGMVIPMARAYIGDLCPKGEEGKWHGYANGAFFGGFAAGPIMGGLIGEWYGMNASFYAMGGLSLLSLLLTLFFLPEMEPQQVAGRSKSFKGLFQQASTSSMMQGLTSFRAVLGLARGCLTTFLPVLAASSLGIGTGAIGILVTAHNIPRAAVQPFFGKLADRFNRRTLVIIGAIFIIIFFSLIPGQYNYWQLLVLVILGGVVFGMPLSPLAALYTEQGRTFGMGTAMSLEMLAMAIGMGIGPIVGGLVADALNVGSVFYFSAGALLVGSFLFFMLTRGYKFNTAIAAQKASDIQPDD